MMRMRTFAPPEARTLSAYTVGETSRVCGIWWHLKISVSKDGGKRAATEVFGQQKR